jgi:hypothetical protein
MMYHILTIQKTPEGIRIHQSGYIESLVSKFGANSNSNFPIQLIQTFWIRVQMTTRQTKLSILL